MLRLLLAACLALAAPASATPADTLRTRAEQTDYRATSRYADVITFVEAIDAEPGFHGTTFGTTAEGRALPLVVWGADDATPEAVRASGNVRVLVFANIHAGEVAGKEAALMLLRDLASGAHEDWGESLTLLVAPIYNADGNERFDPGNRPFQHGPVDGMGQRANAQGLDLNRDFVKLDAPESRALVGVMNRYDPHVVIDLHTTNGSVHGYHLTYAPPLHPNTSSAIDALLRDDWLPDVTEAVEAKYGWDFTYYGNDKPEWGQPRGWATFDPRPRFGILSEAYSYATFRDRVVATLRFVTETLDWASDHAPSIRRAVAAADQSVVGDSLWLRAARTWQASDEPGEILLGGVVEDQNPHTGEPMWRRTDEQTPTDMTIYGRFSGRDRERVPAAYLVPDTLTTLIERLSAHGVRMVPLVEPGEVAVETFRVDSVRAASRPFQRRYERELFGRYETDTVVPDAGTLMIPVAQPLGRLAFSLLEPRSDSGFANWGFIQTEEGEAFPIRRIIDPSEVQNLSR